MDAQHEITRLRAEVEQLTAENAALRDDGFRGSKAEALMALEYDRIPTFMKSQRAVAWQRKIATAVMIVVPLILVVVAVLGGISFYHDQQSSEEMRRLNAQAYSDFSKSPSGHH
jgi:cell division protein FtsB